MRKSRKQLLQSRVREMKRKMLHQHDRTTRDIWNNHILHLENEIKGLN